MTTSRLIIATAVLALANGTADLWAAVLAGGAVGIPLGAWIQTFGVAKAAISSRSLQSPKPRSKSTTNIASGTLALSKIFMIVILVAIVAVAGVVGAYIYSANTSSASSCSSTQTLSGTVVQISITSGASNPSGAPGYNPDNAVVIVGVNSTVVWKNNDSVHHTVTTSSAPTSGSFNSGDISSGACYIHVFDVAGTYKYYCTYHSWMIGTIVVLS
jgi:plastocyanin